MLSKPIKLEWTSPRSPFPLRTQQEELRLETKHKNGHLLPGRTQFFAPFAASPKLHTQLWPASRHCSTVQVSHIKTKLQISSSDFASFRGFLPNFYPIPISYKTWISQEAQKAHTYPPRGPWDHLNLSSHSHHVQLMGTEVKFHCPNDAAASKVFYLKNLSEIDYLKWSIWL